MAKRNKIVFKGRIRDGDSWIPFKVVQLKSDFYELDLDDGGMNVASGQFFHVHEAIQHVLDNYGSW